MSALAMPLGGIPEIRVPWERHSWKPKESSSSCKSK